MIPDIYGSEPVRDYLFYFRIYYNPLMSAEGIYKRALSLKASAGSASKLKFIKQLTQVAKNLFDTTTLEYVSSMAKKVSPPAHTLDFDSLDVGGIQIPIPAKYKINSFNVDYLDDAHGSVYNFHLGWQNSIRNGWNFELLSLVSLSCIFGNVQRNPSVNGGDDSPTTAENFPQIFPASIQRGDYDKTSSGQFQNLTVTYVRIPRIMDNPLTDAIHKGLSTVKQFMAF